MSVRGANEFYRVCTKIYARIPDHFRDDAAVLVPIFHEWIRDGRLGLVLLDVADYAHTPDGPGIMLVAHEASFALDRSDGHLGLLVQRRTPVSGDAAEAIALTVRDTFRAAELLEADPRINGSLMFDFDRVRIESNDRLLVPNTEEGYRSFEPFVLRALEAVFGEAPSSVTRVANDPRDRLAVVAAVGRGLPGSSELGRGRDVNVGT
jgi:hypothetical protein